ncbi:MAG: hypothetical protein J0M00_00760 [Burkholderiales bacterium]|nr:hypothetical protein [Burkholderiales bacterium]
MNKFKQIKIVAESASTIEAALAAANGKATRHTFSTYNEIADLARYGETRLERMRLPQAERPGAKVDATSGDAMPKAYKYTRNGTRVQLLRRGAGWYLQAAEVCTLWPQDRGGARLTLTAEQDAEALRRFRATYTFEREATALPMHAICFLAAFGDVHAQEVVAWLLPQLSAAQESDVRAVIYARDTRSVMEAILGDIERAQNDEGFAAAA